MQLTKEQAHVILAAFAICDEISDRNITYSDKLVKAVGALGEKEAIAAAFDVIAYIRLEWPDVWARFPDLPEEAENA